MAPSRRRGANKAAAAARRQWKIGDLVLAKVKGFPAWPATVSEPEKWGYAADLKKVLVYFFGTQQIAFCNPADVEAFTEEKKESLLGKRHGKGSDFVRAVNEIIESYEKLKKPESAGDANITIDHTLVNENNSGELLVKSFANGGAGEAPKAKSQSCEGRTLGIAEEDDMNVKSEISTGVIGRDGLQDGDIPERENNSSLVAADMAMANANPSRNKFERAEADKCFTRRRPPSARQTRSTSRAVPSKLQSETNRSRTLAPKILRDGPGRRNKRIRKSPDIFSGRDVDSPDLVSNGSMEGNDSEILTADSDSLSLNEGSTVESECKPILPDSATELCHRNVDLSHRLDFQTNGIHKKKRMHNRKRPSSDAVELTARPDEKTVSDTVKAEHIFPGDQEISTERSLKEDGDEHLPLVKRARVRMGRALSTAEQLEASLDAEEKPLEGFCSIVDNGHVSSDREGDCLTYQNLYPAKGGLQNSSPSVKHQANKHLVWEGRKYQHLGSLVDGEAALPPSKRLHRALEAMSANAAEGHQMASDLPSFMKVDAGGCCSSSENCSKLYSERKLSNELGGSKVGENFGKNVSVYDTSELSVKLDVPIKEGRLYSGEVATCCSDDSTQRESCKEDIDSLDARNVLEFSSRVLIDSAVVKQSPKLLSPSGADLNSQRSPGVALPTEDGCRTGSSELANLDSKTDLLSADDITSPHASTIVETDSAEDKCNETVNVCQLIQDNKKLADGMSKNVGEMGLAMGDSCATFCSVPVDVISNDNEDPDQSRYDYAANDHLVDKTILVAKSSPSSTENADVVTLTKPYSSTCNMFLSVDSSIQVDGSCSPVSHSHHGIPKNSCNWNYKEAYDALASFKAILGTLTRTKESIGCATRSAIDCAKFGVASKVVEILANSLEHESSLHKRVDLFFLVDSITQCSRLLKGDSRVYPSAILAVLPRLLSAAAPPGSNSQENRKQCLKVLRVWQERKILPESIVRQHIRELDSLCVSSCSRVFSRRLRNERSFDDPIREMEGMLVDEYGSNSSIQLPGFCMPPMLKDEDDGIDSDGESFEAVTPEHDIEKSEVERNLMPVVEKHPHILEDVDGELEMEDVAPSSEAVISSSTSANSENLQMTHHSIGHAVVVVPFAPPLPKDVPPVSPPLPKSPPPPPPLGHQVSFALPPERPDHLSSGVRSKVYIPSQNIEADLRESTGSHSIGLAGNSKISEAAQPSRPCHIDFHSQVSTQIPNSNHCLLSCRPNSNLPVQSVNNIPPSDGAFSKGFHLRPPYPAPSNQFSFVQADRRVQSQRDIQPPSHPNRFHVQNNENGIFFGDCDRMKLAPHDNGEHWRAPFPGSRYPDGSRMPDTPTPFTGQHGEPPLPNNRWAFPPGAMNHRGFIPHRPPAGGPIPVAARGPNGWRPR